ncbi:hypothetical protein MAPG_04606 [Magnaporthiopsis poae ATCC 64411]|uniref:Uncharacterized protein n=1 Tax=Magnaporthiopsis poae (strain ATCC 64411 / 73-15) TaxID=644358 RepID=A0A0C4DX68_MAGP6|nr:hypothetical protein MAPG_04606 [Magnaporthiopsis poae ATCC 64411]
MISEGQTARATWLLAGWNAKATPCRRGGEALEGCECRGRGGRLQVLTHISPSSGSTLRSPGSLRARGVRAAGGGCRDSTRSGCGLFMAGHELRKSMWRKISVKAAEGERQRTELRQRHWIESGWCFVDRGVKPARTVKY